MDRWGPAEFLIPRLSSSNRFALTRSGDALSILCDEAVLSLRKEDGRCNAAWFGSVGFTLASDATANFAMQVRGYVAKSEGARAAIVVDVAGGIVTRDYPYGQAVDEDFLVETSFSVHKWMNRRITLSFALLLERQSDEDEAALAFDSSDAAVIQLLPP
jgi:hypothetical protein